VATPLPPQTPSPRTDPGGNTIFLESGDYYVALHDAPGWTILLSTAQSDEINVTLFPASSSGHPYSID